LVVEVFWVGIVVFVEFEDFAGEFFLLVEVGVCYLGVVYVFDVDGYAGFFLVELVEICLTWWVRKFVVILWNFLVVLICV